MCQITTTTASAKSPRSSNFGQSRVFKNGQASTSPHEWTRARGHSLGLDLVSNPHFFAARIVR
jgi:hypothetical protein